MTPPLDIMTPRGQMTVSDEAAAAAIWESWNCGWKYVSTPKDRPSQVDAILSHDGVVEAIAETKCRYGMTLNEFMVRFSGEWLVTLDKVLKASQISASLSVPLYGFLYIVSEGVLLTRRLTDSSGQFCVPFRADNTITQRSVNGGSAMRSNAFIDMREAKQWRARVAQ